MKFKVGDKVKIREDLSFGRFGDVYFNDSMKRYRGREAKITYIDPYDNTYHLDIDDNNWWWTNGMLELYEAKRAEMKKSDLKDGDYIIFKNKERAIKIGKCAIMDSGVIPLKEYNNKLEHNFNSNLDIARVDRPTKYETIYKNDEILDGTEKKYLAAVIRPFRDEIKAIIKEKDVSYNNGYYLCISLKNNDWANLPSFNSETMYVGMKQNKEYTLEELGL